MAATPAGRSQWILPRHTGLFDTAGFLNLGQVGWVVGLTWFETSLFWEEKEKQEKDGHRSEDKAN